MRVPCLEDAAALSIPRANHHTKPDCRRDGSDSTTTSTGLGTKWKSSATTRIRCLLRSTALWNATSPLRSPKPANTGACGSAASPNKNATFEWVDKSRWDFARWVGPTNNGSDNCVRLVVHPSGAWDGFRATQCDEPLATLCNKSI
ncbi:hypothetical protein L596_015289 [Steinernema carpocapsae]|uniref:C-type lectin domain-containing protein n=1 Tax=Steinernema carpocapsae TaxID=34508 RepID=A0A4U5NFJ0_STECR|nr:hypothetical protein L596_015289 [Steinernema carpocapsae]